jgi:hypothetical protein
MLNSKQLAGLIGPTIIAVTLSEIVNYHIWAGNTATGVYLNGALLFVAGLSIIRVHNHWATDWSITVTLVGWLALLLGLLRMFLPELQLQSHNNAAVIIPGVIALFIVGVFLTVKGWARE